MIKELDVDNIITQLLSLRETPNKQVYIANKLFKCLGAGNSLNCQSALMIYTF